MHEDFAGIVFGTMFMSSFIFLNFIVFGFDLMFKFLMEKRILFLGLLEFLNFEDGFGEQHDGDCDDGDE